MRKKNIVKTASPLQRTRASQLDRPALATAFLETQTATKRPLSTSILALPLLLAGFLLFAGGLLLLFVRIETEFVFNPFHHVISIRINRWELGILCAALAAWFTFTGRGLWRLRRAALISAWGIAGLMFVRGLLALAPPIEAGDVKAASWLMGVGFVAMIVLRCAGPAFK